MRLEHWAQRKVKRVYLLSDPEKMIEFYRAGMELCFAVPQPYPDPIATVIVVEFEASEPLPGLKSGASGLSDSPPSTEAACRV